MNILKREAKKKQKQNYLKRLDEPLHPKPEGIEPPKRAAVLRRRLAITVALKGGEVEGSYE